MQRQKILKKLKKELDPARFKHSLRVEKIALALAHRYGVSAEKAGLAGLLHDCAKNRTREPLEHAPLSAVMAQKRFRTKDKQILSAIRKHTLGSPGMTKLEKIIYLADKVEMGRRFTGINTLRALTLKNLDQAVFLSASRTMEYLLKKNLAIDSATLATRNYYLNKK